MAAATACLADALPPCEAASVTGAAIAPCRDSQILLPHPAHHQIATPMPGRWLLHQSLHGGALNLRVQLQAEHFGRRIAIVLTLRDEPLPNLPACRIAPRWPNDRVPWRTRASSAPDSGRLTDIAEQVGSLGPTHRHLGHSSGNGSGGTPIGRLESRLLRKVSKSVGVGFFCSSGLHSLSVTVMVADAGVPLCRSTSIVHVPPLHSTLPRLPL